MALKRQESLKTENLADKREMEGSYSSGIGLTLCHNSLFVFIIDLRLQILCKSGEAALAANFTFVL